MESNLIESAKTDKIMWFSMWLLISIITFGLAFFPMFYFLIERRNKHFVRQKEMEKQVLKALNEDRLEEQDRRNPPLSRNGVLWTASIVLVVPAFVALYILSKDLMLHEKNQQDFLKRILPGLDYKPQRFSMSTYVLVTVATLGLGGVYWLYRVFSVYNNHFREHRVFDEEINRLIEALNHD